MIKDTLVSGELAQAILTAVKNKGEWCSAAEIAEILGRPRGVQPYDREILNALVSVGKLEIQYERLGVVKTRALYRAMEE